MSAPIDLGRLEAILHASGVPARIETMLSAGVRPRQLRVHTLLLGILITLADERPPHLRRIHLSLIGLPDAQKRRLGVTCAWKNGPHELTYRQTEYTFARVVTALAEQKRDGRPSEPPRVCWRQFVCLIIYQ